MWQLVFVLISFALLAVFIALTELEKRRGSRFFAGYRAYFDERVERVEFVFSRVDFAAFIKEELQSLAQHGMHAIVHISLNVVRAIERLLTRLIKHLRMQRDVQPAPRENAREFVRTLSDFKDQLKETQPEIPDILEEDSK